MANFNLDNYEPVEERLARFWADHKTGRIITDLVPAPEGQWIIKTLVWRDGSTVEPDATGYAHEVVGSSGVNRTSALENCETSSIGRALANLGYAPKGARPSREEMAKAQRTATKPAPRKPSPTDQQISAWALAMSQAENMATLDAVAGEPAQYDLTDMDRSNLRTIYLNRKQQLETSNGATS